MDVLHTLKLILIQLPRYSRLTSDTPLKLGAFTTMIITRLTPRRARSRLAAGPVFGECLQDQRVKRPGANRRINVGFEYESSTQSGDDRPLSPA
jgi:hypothetical protein